MRYYFLICVSFILFLIPNVSNSIEINFEQINEIYAPDELPWTELTQLSTEKKVVINSREYFKDVPEEEYNSNLRYPGQNLQVFARPKRHQVKFYSNDKYLHLTYEWVGTGALLGLGKTYYIKIKTRLDPIHHEWLLTYTEFPKYKDLVRKKTNEFIGKPNYYTIHESVNNYLNLMHETQDFNELMEYKNAIRRLLGIKR